MYFMNKELLNFVTDVRMWLFSIEADLSLGSLSHFSSSSLSVMLEQLDGLYSKAYNVYGYDLDEIVKEFPRVYKEYNLFVNG